MITDLHVVWPVHLALFMAPFQDGPLRAAPPPPFHDIFTRVKAVKCWCSCTQTCEAPVRICTHIHTDRDCRTDMVVRTRAELASHMCAHMQHDLDSDTQTHTHTHAQTWVNTRRRWWYILTRCSSHCLLSAPGDMCVEMGGARQTGSHESLWAEAFQECELHPSLPPLPLQLRHLPHVSPRGKIWS